MNPWLVEYYEGSVPQYFYCEAEDGQHAIDQCADAYPEATITRDSPINWSPVDDYKVGE